MGDGALADVVDLLTELRHSVQQLLPLSLLPLSHRLEVLLVKHFEGIGFVGRVGEAADDRQGRVLASFLEVSDGAPESFDGVKAAAVDGSEGPLFCLNLGDLLPELFDFKLVVEFSFDVIVGLLLEDLDLFLVDVHDLLEFFHLLLQSAVGQPHLLEV